MISGRFVNLFSDFSPLCAMALPSVTVEWNFNNGKEVRKTTFYLLICVNMRSDTFQQNIVGNSIPLLLIKMGKKQKDYNLQSIFKIFYDVGKFSRFSTPTPLPLAVSYYYLANGRQTRMTLHLANIK